MASLRTLPGTKNLIACFTDIHGKRRQRSTGTHVRKDAKRIADQYEAAARTLKTEAQIRRVMTDIFKEIHGKALVNSTPEVFLSDWLKRKGAENADATASAYTAVVKRFLAHLGPRAKSDLDHITASDVLSFRDGLIGQLSTTSINHQVKIVRIAFNSAIRGGLMQSNPAMQIENLHSKKTQDSASKKSRRPFTMDELQKLLSVVNQEWKELILFGLYTGQRLGDLGELTWGNMHLEERELRFKSKKTGRNVVLPLARPLLRLIGRRSNGGETTPFFPAAADKISKSEGKVGTLSNQFYSNMAKAGLVPRRSKKATGKGRSSQREGTELCFHCLRHNTTSMLKNAGISDVVAREFVGHESAAISKLYTHIETETLRGAVDRLVDVSNL